MFYNQDVDQAEQDAIILMTSVCMMMLEIYIW